MAINPVTCLDYPDPDVIRVGDTYYMISTTMHFMPGGEILQSKDLAHWEHLTYIYEFLDHTPQQQMKSGGQIYGKGMWAASLRHHKGIFYACFVANDTHTTYLYKTEKITGPWERIPISGFYHDCSLLFDEDGRIYIAYGNRDIHITELKEDLSGPKPGGLDRIAISDVGNPYLGYEGTHFYRIRGKYYLFCIHSRRDRWRRTEACFVADSLDGEFVGGDVMDDDLGYCGQGAAQGGIVDTPDGNWYAMVFQDRGAVGRIPILVPIRWEKDFPVFGEYGRVPEEFPIPRPAGTMSLVDSDDFTSTGDRQTHGCFGLKSCWQFNHEPELSLTAIDREQGRWSITTGQLSSDVTQARNTLTQRMLFPACAAQVTVLTENLKIGDIAGLCVLQGCYGLIGIVRREDGFYLTMRSREADKPDLNPLGPDALIERIWEEIPWQQPWAEFRADADFTQMRDTVRFLYRSYPGEDWKQLGGEHKLYFKMDHFTGSRFGLFLYATKQIGGRADFRQFLYQKME